MSRRTDALDGLGRIARLKSDLEMRRLSAFRAHVEAARDRIAHLENDMDALYRAQDGFSIAEARLANALAGERSRALLKAEQELAHLLPGFEQARQLAAREFGRAEAVKALRAQVLEKARLEKSRRGA